MLGTTQPGGPWNIAFKQRLAELGHREGDNLVLEYLYDEGIPARAPGLAARLIALNPNVIVAVAPPAAYAVSRLTTTIPIVFVSVGRPVEMGLVTSLTRPGGNVTGISLDVTAEIHAKQLQFLQEVVRAGRGTRLGVLWNPDMRGVAEYVQESERAARTVGIVLQAFPVRNETELDAAIAQAAKQGNRGLACLPDTMMFGLRRHLVALAATHHLPAIYPFRAFVDEGGLMAYGPDLVDLNRRAADYVDKIIRGAAPGDLPVSQPTKFELVIKRKTAKALGLTIPPSLLARADQVIE